MNKETFHKIYLLMLMLVFCSYFSGVAFAGVCDECNNSGGVPTFSGNFTVPPEWRDIKWAPDNKEVINRNDTLTVRVINGTYPYFWSVSGTGFSVNTDSEGTSNTLTADDTACGAAEITVLDSDGKPETLATGYVREEGSGASDWYAIDIIVPCPIPGPAMEIDSWNNLKRWQGKYHVMQSYASCKGFCESCDCKTCEEAKNDFRCGSQFTEGVCIDLESLCTHKGNVLTGGWCCTNEDGTRGGSYIIKNPYYHLSEWRCR